MNVLQLAHNQIRSKFYARIISSLFRYAGFAAMFYADWRIAVGVFLVLTSVQMTGDTK
jgi:hypothetical protein